MTKARLDRHPSHDKKDLFSDLIESKPAADRFDAPVELGPFQRIIVAGFHALVARKTRRALEVLRPDRLRDIGLDPSDIDRTVEDTADQAAEAFARRLDSRRQFADQGAGLLNAELDYLMRAGRMQR
ncbi:hypothetical protein ACOTTU_21155 [Roseobacter sp. EG26]|uniref:hypothetical protein n=1 Tax=Roseobacter sp. EG26 TaxID=3412477 RepID=UPI003CE47848